MSTATLPVAPPANAAPAPGAASPAGSPPAAAPAAAAPAPLSTASLSAAITAQLTGAKPTPTPAASPEPSPAAGSPPASANPAPAPAPDAAPPSPDDDETAPPNASPEVVAAMANYRKQRKELKTQLKTVTEELGAMKAELAKLHPPQPGAAKPPETPPSKLDIGASPELTAAQEVVTEQEGLRNWSRSQMRALSRAMENESDTTALLATLQAQVTKFGVTLPTEPEAVLTWLEGVRTDAEDKLEEAHRDVRFIRQEAEAQHATARTEGETFAREFAPKIFEAGTEEAKRFELIKQNLPGLAEHPLGMRFITAAVRGWPIIKGEIEARNAEDGTRNGKPVNGSALPAPRSALPTGQPVALPGTPALVPARPNEGPESSSSIFAKYRESLANPAATEQEREALKLQWVKAAITAR